MIRLDMSKHFGSKIFTRNTISSFFKEIKDLKENKIVLDFKKIDFISRSCVDEYLKLKEKLKSKVFIEENLSEEVQSMFKIVRHQYKSLGLIYLRDSLRDEDYLTA